MEDKIFAMMIFRSKVKIVYSIDNTFVEDIANIKMQQRMIIIKDPPIYFLEEYIQSVPYSRYEKFEEQVKSEKG